MDSGLANVIIAALATALISVLLSSRGKNKTDVMLAAMGVVAANQTTLIAAVQETVRLLTSIQGEHTAEIKVLQSEQKQMRVDLHEARNKMTGMLMKQESK